MKKLHSILVAVSISLAMALTLPSCSGGGGDSGGSEKSLLLNFTSDYTDGELRWMPTDSNSLNAGKIPFDQDSRVFAYKGQIFLLERPLDKTTFVSNGKLKCLTPPLSSTTHIDSVKLEDGSNPSDIAFIGKKGYIALYGLNYIQAFNVNSCTLAEKIYIWKDSTVARPSYAPSIKAKGNTLLVVTQRWTAYPNTATNGVLIRINADTKKRIDSIPLTYYNPQTSILHGDTLYIGSAWDLTDIDFGGLGIIEANSGVEFVSLSNKKDSILVPGTTLQGGVTSMALDSAGQLYMGVYKSWGNVPVKSIPISGGILTDVSPTSIEEATCMVYDKDTKKLFIGNGTAGSDNVAIPSLMVYNTIGGGSATPVLNSDYPANAFPPYSLAIVRYNDPD